jgi:hypothetical protein
LRSVFDDEAASTPGFIHIDSFALSGSQHCFVAIDRATRMAYLQVVERHDSDAACAFLDRCRAFFPFELHTVLTDNGGEYTLKGCAPSKHQTGRKRPFEDACARCSITHKTTRPYRPQTNGLVERMNGLIKQAVIEGQRYAGRDERTRALHIWLINYNFNRRHRRIPIGRMTPFEAACQWHSDRPELFTKGQPSKQATIRSSTVHNVVRLDILRRGVGERTAIEPEQSPNRAFTAARN